jgi:hypothetical protein
MKKAKRKHNKSKHRATVMNKSKAQRESERMSTLAPISPRDTVKIYLPRRP